MLERIGVGSEFKDRLGRRGDVYHFTLRGKLVPWSRRGRVDVVFPGRVVQAGIISREEETRPGL